jgi:uncharacterized membrane protein YozB (DUF420 family)
MSSVIQWLTGPGFLGAGAPLHSDLSLLLILLAAGLFTWGWRLAAHRHYESHRWVQTTAATLNALVVLSVMIVSFVKFILPGVPGKLLEGSYGVTTVHAMVGAFGLILGIFVVVRANRRIPKRLSFKNIRQTMRVSYAFYRVSTLLGIVVYIAAFVLKM